MAVLALKIIDKDGNTRYVSRGENEVILVNTSAYQEGDRINLETSEKNIHVIWQVDDAMGPAEIYLTGNADFFIPFGEKRISYSPKAFYGERHYLYARVAREEEIAAYRNLAYNVADQHEAVCAYPHATANVETRGEAVFAARNAIDGVVANASHGEWPYESWGINMQDDAEMTIDFGRVVTVDKIRLYTRADFPHDNWWKQVTIRFSDETSFVWDLEKSSLPHEISIDKKSITSITICDMKKSEEPSPFPALTQMEVYGWNGGI